MNIAYPNTFFTKTLIRSGWNLRIYDGFAFERRSAPFVKSYIP
ncbi:hypothetical protein LEP1GSC188_2991 [Leptospira weilii serovar Topaz str. LT2116]|uniref:Uncharacterized protein n=1 Tax=Leptospira weilii serovar Topaz str. LT2116 TaxID=1088540 RepID=M3H1G5_9LEPT|nr:hypothetical protein LEP1GSC188_2991 [Leptospira weilii serovar Topaz str. LT2116]